MKRIEALIVVMCCLLLVFLISGCGLRTGEGDVSGLQEPGVLVIATGVDLYNIDPAVGFDYALASTSMALYDNLYRYKGNPPELIPWLAERYEVSESALEWTFYLRKDAQFHDGSLVTAYAVKYSMERLLEIGKGPASFFSGLVDKDGIIVVDDYIIKFRLLKPFSQFLNVIPWLFIVNPGLVEEHRGSDWAQSWLAEHEAGSGPFIIKEWVPGRVYEFKAVEDYWRGWPSEGRLSGFRRLVISDASKRAEALIKGDAYMADWMLPEDQLMLKNAYGMILTEMPAMDTYEIKLNHKNKYLSDLNVRRAISYAFDYEALRLVWVGRAELMTGPLPAGSEWVNKGLEAYRLNISRAREELAKSQWPSGGFELDYLYVTGLEEERLTGIILKEQLAELNISVNIIPVSWADAVALFKNPSSAPPMFPLYSSTAYSDPDNYLWSGYHSSQAGEWTNPGHYINTGVDGLLEKARNTLDVAQRKELYGEAQQITIDEAANIFGVTRMDDHVISPVIKGYAYCPIMGAYEDFYWFRLEE